MAIQEPAVAASLGDRFALGRIEITIAGRDLEIIHPRSVEELIREDDFEVGQVPPYWAAIWPSSRVLAERIAVRGRAESVAGRRVLELGCGVGLVSLGAALAGFDVLATDFFAEACQFTAANAERNGIAGVRTRVIDWRNYPSDLGEFDYVLASDVLYERGHAALVAAALAQSLAPGGVAWLTDPGRSVARPLADECRRQRLECECIDLEEVNQGATNCVIELFEIRRHH
jgi:ETFB lysine methyltransferase